MKLKKFLLSSFVVLAVTAYAVYQRLGGGADKELNLSPDLSLTLPTSTQTLSQTTTQTQPQGQNLPSTKPVSQPSNPESVTTQDPSETTATTQAPIPATTTAPTSATTQTSTQTGSYKDGEYLGPSVSTIFGNVQVSAVISGGKIVDIKFLEFPNDRATSISISNESLPRLRSEAIVVQSAKIDVVSGATQTSEGFIESLASALVQAKL